MLMSSAYQPVSLLARFHSSSGKASSVQPSSNPGVNGTNFAFSGNR